MSNEVTFIPNRLKNASKNDPYVTGAEDIDAGGKSQQTVNDTQAEKNGQVDEHLSTHDAEIEDRYTKEQVNNIVSRTPESDIVVVNVPEEGDIPGYLSAAVPVNERPNNLFRVPGPGNTTYSEWAWDGNVWVKLREEDYGIDDELEQDSDNSVKGSGIYKSLERGILSHDAAPDAVWWELPSLRDKRVKVSMSCADNNAQVELYVNSLRCSPIKAGTDIFLDFTNLGTHEEQEFIPVPGTPTPPNSSGTLTHEATESAVWWEINEFAGNILEIRLTASDNYTANLFLDGVSTGYGLLNGAKCKFDLRNIEAAKLYFNSSVASTLEYWIYNELPSSIEVEEAASYRVATNGSFYTSDYTSIIYKSADNGANVYFPTRDPVSKSYLGWPILDTMTFIIGGYQYKWNGSRIVAESSGSTIIVEDVPKLYFKSNDPAKLAWKTMDDGEFPEIQSSHNYRDAGISSYYTPDYKSILFRRNDNSAHQVFPVNEVGQFHIAAPTGREIFIIGGEKYIWSGTELTRVVSDNSVTSGVKGTLRRSATQEAVWWNLAYFAGKKIRLRLVTGADSFSSALFLDNATEAAWKLKKTWQRFDFSQISSIRVYYNCPEDATLEWEEYKDGVGAIIEVKKVASYTEAEDGDLYTTDYERIAYRESESSAYEVFPTLTEDHSFYRGQIPTGNEFFLIEGIFYRWNGALGKFDPYLNGSSIIKEKEMLDSAQSFVRRVSRYDRWAYNLPLAPIKDVIDAKGSCILKLTITTDPLVGHNGSLFLNDSTLKTAVAFGGTPIEGVFVAECIVIVTEEDYIIAAGLGRDYLQIIWQYGNPSDSDACTYTVKSIISEAMMGASSGGSSVTVNRISVKKDGTGMFTNIQDAINSITDASENNRYEIDIYDDFVSSDFTDLHLISNPNVRVESESDINSLVSYVTTKNWVSLIGKGGRKEIWFINPDINTPSNLFQHIQVMYVQGNGKLENLDIRIKGGRYGIHQDKTGDTSDANPDVDAITEYIDCHIEHIGNDEYINGNAWGTSAGLAACPSSGGTIKVINSYITAKTDPLICHLNKGYKNGINYILKGTTIVCKNPNLSLDNIGSYMNDFGSNQRNKLVMIGCNIPHLNGSGKQGNGYDSVNAPTDVNCGGIFVSGYGNEKAYIQYHSTLGLYVRSANFNSQIDVVGGTAKSLIFGDNPTIYHGDAKNYGIAVGNIGINVNGDTVNGVSSYIRSLPYILGNCANEPKTLIVRVDGTDHTITFNKNYMTSDGSAYGPTTAPAISGTAILQEVNDSFRQNFVIDNSADMPYMNHPHFIKLYSFSDCMEIGINTSDEAWKPWQCVKRDYTKGVKGWRLANVGETPDGIVGERINAPYNGKYYEGVIILADKVIFGCGTNTKYMNVNAGAGTKLAVGENSYLVVSQSADAPFVIVSSNGTFVKN